MALNLFGPSMIDLQYMLNTTMSMISLCQTATGVGSLIGALCSFLYVYINRQFTVIVMTSLMYVFSVLIILCPDIWWTIGAFIVAAVGAGAWDSVSSIWIVEMWQQNSDPLMQVLQCMYGLGSIIGPLILAPYLTGDLKPDNQTVSTLTTQLPLITTTDINNSVDRRSKLIAPYVMVGSIGLVVPKILIDQKTEDKYNESDVIVKKSSTDRIILIIILCLTFISYSGLENIYFSYSSTYFQYACNDIDAKTASHMLSVMSATFTGARLVTALIATRLRSQTIIAYSLCLVCISMLILYFGQHSVPLIWTTNALFGLGFSALRPAYYAFAEKSIQLTDRVSALFTVFSSILLILSPLLLGPLIKDHTERSYYKLETFK
ncbi:uncharacterized protein LOC128964054 [Oppia nitens]|uniref:uncharacterized protein LOC128964054 n=1 Tax=Oppia nitens TaxID=1686743 RepID=UPI0023DA8A56|nr:uncharacterized protein LOC128964054 [Oppia nitens]